MSDGSIIIDTKIDNSGAKEGIAKLGGILDKGIGTIGKIGTATVKATGVAMGAVSLLTKQCIDQYSSYEQLTGGIETLFKDSADIVKNYASESYKTAGISANEYMEQATSFSASLIQSLGGDTKKASEEANKAIIDMSDNVNKMGGNIQDIQHAYQGFAKQNYTMLDNLKLGRRTIAQL